MRRFSARLNAFVLLLVAALATGCSGSTTSQTAQSQAPGPEPAEQPAQDPDEASTPADDPAPSAPPEVQLSAADPVVGMGEGVELTWSTENAESCSASGGWNGTRATSGSASVGPIDRQTTFSLTCTGSGGNAVAMLSVSVLGVVSLAWQAPTENVDGTPIDQLAGYRIYYGPDSRSYTDDVVLDGDATSRDLTLASGSYYVAMTAIDADGNESGYSNEVVKIVN